MKHRKIGWVLLSPPAEAQPSTRIAALNMISELAPLGYDSCILFAPKQGTERPMLPPLEPLLQEVQRQGINLVVFQKVHGDAVARFSTMLKALGIKTAYMVCDLVLPDMTAVTDATITVTPYLRRLYNESLRSKVHVVHDGIEHAELSKSDYGDKRGRRGDPLQAVLVTSAAQHSLSPIAPPPPWLRTTLLGRYPSADSHLARLKHRLQKLRALEGVAARLSYLRFASHPRVSLEPWSEQRAYEALLAADIGIIPVANQETAPDGDALPPMWMRKSENRLTMKMALGLPVIASPVPAYLDVVEHGVNGFIARSPADWQDCLSALRDPALRREMGTKARQTVVERFSRARQARLLASVFDQVLGMPPVEARIQVLAPTQ